MEKAINKKILTHIGFWVIVYAYYLASNWSSAPDKVELFPAMSLNVAMQIILAYASILVLLPHLLSKNRKVLFFISLLLLLVFTHSLYVTLRFYFFEPWFSDYYSIPPGRSYLDRITDFSYFLSNITKLILPAVLLLAHRYYSRQKELVELREQKKMAELETLRNQLNPHFLFNTLNNLYTLALKKSEKTPEVVAKLAEILDHMLYKCKDDLVFLKDEVKLLNNYLDLEKLRYGERVEINFDYQISNNIKIAPLILLTLTENAFKHGVSQEIGTAFVHLDLTSNENGVTFRVKNSIPIGGLEQDHAPEQRIGLRNIEKQLNILYPNDHLLEVGDSKNEFMVKLNLGVR